MIIACPACKTRYAVPDDAIGIAGRTVRCAKCKHSWHQPGGTANPPLRDAPLSGSVSPSPTSQAPQSAPKSPTPADSLPPSDFVPEPAPVSPPPATSEYNRDTEAGTAERKRSASAPLAAASQGAAAASQFAYEPPFRPRRNPARLWTLVAAAFAVVALCIAGAVAVFGLPGWMNDSGMTFTERKPGLIIEFPPEKQDRRTLPNGTEYFSATGAIVNTSQSVQKVPGMLIVLRDARGRIVYNWEVRSPVDQLGPGQRANFNEAVIDIPKSATQAEIGWSPEG